MSDDPLTTSIRERQTLGKDALEKLLARFAPLQAQATSSASSLYLRPGEAEQFLSRSDPDSLGWRERLSLLDGAILKSDTGLCGLRSGDEALVIVPPFPLPEGGLTPGWDTTPLLTLLAKEYTVGVVLLRLGRYAVAVYQGDTLLSSKTDTRYVKGKHHAGGTSQKRFQRIREGQIRRIYDKTCEVARAQFDPYAAKLDYVLTGGERFTLNGFLKDCDYMARFQPITLGRRLNIRDPKRDTLEDVGSMIKESRIYLINW